LATIDSSKKLPDLDQWTERLVGKGATPPPVTTTYLYTTSSAGLTGVWAEQNTREAIFDALRRRETFATSGTRIKLRFFGAWSFPSGLLKNKDWVTTAYSSGVSMGGDLPRPPAA